MALFIEEEISLDYLIPQLRILLGDTVEESFRYSDAYVRTALVCAVKALAPRWKYRYSINDSYEVSRNHNFLTFTDAEPPIIQRFDEFPICLMASILIKSGTVQESSWAVSSWADDEIRYSNIQAAASRDDSLRRDIDMLEAIVPSRGKKLARVKKQSLPGFTEEIGNIWESEREP